MKADPSGSESCWEPWEHGKALCAKQGFPHLLVCSIQAGSQLAGCREGLTPRCLLIPPVTPTLGNTRPAPLDTLTQPQRWGQACGCSRVQDRYSPAPQGPFWPLGLRNPLREPCIQHAWTLYIWPGQMERECRHSFPERPLECPVSEAGGSEGEPVGQSAGESAHGPRPGSTQCYQAGQGWPGHL